MKISVASFIFIKCIAIAVCLNPSNGSAQYSEGFQLEGYSIKTDAIRLLETAITKSESYSVSGEIYFNNEYSFNLEAGIETERGEGLNTIQKELTGQFRWYFNQDDCSCSAFFAGVYVAGVSIYQTVQHQSSNSDAGRYKLSAFESGFCGGYQAIFLDHFIIDPALEAGWAIHQDIQGGEILSEYSGVQEEGLLIRIRLGVGYRFE